MSTEHHTQLELVLQTARALSNAASSPDDETLVTLLVADGVDPIIAEKLAVLVPLAFGRVLIRGLGISSFPDEFFVKSENGDWQSFLLSNEHAYTCALAVAEHAFTEGSFPRDVLTALSTRSAEFNCVNDALHAGVDVHDGVLSSQYFLRISAEAWRSAAQLAVNKAEHLYRR